MVSLSLSLSLSLHPRTSTYLWLFLKELTENICERDVLDIQLPPDLIEVLILLFADDVILLSDSVTNSETQLNTLFNTAKHLDSVVNLDKSDCFQEFGPLILP